MDAQFEYDRAVLRLESALRELLDKPDSAEAHDRGKAALQMFWMRRRDLYPEAKQFSLKHVEEAAS